MLTTEVRLHMLEKISTELGKDGAVKIIQFKKSVDLKTLLTIV